MNARRRDDVCAKFGGKQHSPSQGFKGLPGIRAYRKYVPGVCRLHFNLSLPIIGHRAQSIGFQQPFSGATQANGSATLLFVELTGT